MHNNLYCLSLSAPNNQLRFCMSQWPSFMVIAIGLPPLVSCFSQICGRTGTQLSLNLEKEEASKCSHTIHVFAQGIGHGEGRKGNTHQCSGTAAPPPPFRQTNHHKWFLLPPPPWPAPLGVFSQLIPPRLVVNCIACTFLPAGKHAGHGIIITLLLSVWKSSEKGISRPEKHCN